MPPLCVTHSSKGPTHACARRYRRIHADEPLGPVYGAGFISSGLWGYSRHPNYFCEVSLWWAFYLFSIAAGLPLLNWCACAVSAAAAATTTITTTTVSATASTTATAMQWRHVV